MRSISIAKFACLMFIYPSSNWNFQKSQISEHQKYWILILFLVYFWAFAFWYVYWFMNEGLLVKLWLICALHIKSHHNHSFIHIKSLGPASRPTWIGPIGFMHVTCEFALFFHLHTSCLTSFYFPNLQWNDYLAYFYKQIILHKKGMWPLLDITHMDGTDSVLPCVLC